MTVSLDIRHGTRHAGNKDRVGIHAEVPGDTAAILRAARARAGTSLAELLRAIAQAITEGRILVPEKPTRDRE